MKISTNLNIHKNTYNTTPKTFTGNAINNFKNLVNTPNKFVDIVSIQAFGLKDIKNIRTGEFGTICDGSMPLRNFNDYVNQKNLSNIFKTGISTNRNGYAHSFLKTSADNPISTSFVHDCSVMYLYNRNTNTHMLYHSLWNVSKKHFEFIIKNFMPEGVTNAGITPGHRMWIYRHEYTLPAMFNAIKEVSPDTVVKVYHNNSPFPEIVGHKGSLFEIPNRDFLSQMKKTDSPRDFGQASFQISDIGEYNTLDKIDNENITLEDLKRLKTEFNQKDYDIEVKKVLNSLIDQYTMVLEKMKSLNQKDESFNLKPSQALEFMKGIYKIIKEEVTRFY